VNEPRDRRAAGWAAKFDKGATQPGTFHAKSGDVSAPLMHATTETVYGEGDGYQSVSLAYDGGQLSFVAVLPTDMAKFEPTFDGARAQTIAEGMSVALVDLTMPKFEIKGSSFSVSHALQARGMKDAFSDDAADFSGMITGEKVHVSDVIHQAFINVEEDGTEAAAATAVVVGAPTAAQTTPPKQVKMTMDKPFVFFIRDNATGAIRVLGRILNP
jgi:serpin B